MCFRYAVCRGEAPGYNSEHADCQRTWLAYQSQDLTTYATITSCFAQWSEISASGGQVGFMAERRGILSTGRDLLRAALPDGAAASGDTRFGEVFRDVQGAQAEHRMWVHFLALGLLVMNAPIPLLALSIALVAAIAPRGAPAAPRTGGQPVV